MRLRNWILILILLVVFSLAVFVFTKQHMKETAALNFAKQPEGANAPQFNNPAYENTGAFGRLSTEK